MRVNCQMPWETWTFLAALPRMEVLYHRIHYVDLVRSFLGEPAGVYCKTVKHPRQMQLASTRTAIAFDYGDVKRATITTNHGHDFGPRHQESYFKLEGTEGAIKGRIGVNLDYPRGAPDNLEYCVRRADGGTPEWQAVPLDGSWFPHAFIGTMASVMRRADGETGELPTSIEDAFQTMAVRRGVHEIDRARGHADPGVSAAEHPEMEAFIDTHVHCWDCTQVPYPWLDGFSSIAGRHTPAELRAEVNTRFPAKLVIVEGDCDRARSFDEVAAIEALAAAEPAISGIVAFAPMDRGAETVAALDRLRARPLVRGVRHLIQGEADPGFCRRPEFIAGVRAAGERGLSFDICVKHHQLAPVVDLVCECPGTQFVLDHAGKPDIRGAKARALARADHEARVASARRVQAVGSGDRGRSAQRGPSRISRPYVDHLLARFGRAPY